MSTFRSTPHLVLHGSCDAYILLAEVPGKVQVLETGTQKGKRRSGATERLLDSKRAESAHEGPPVSVFPPNMRSRSCILATLIAIGRLHVAFRLPPYAPIASLELQRCQIARNLR